MDSTIEEKVTARMAELPEDVRQAILSADLERKIQTIGGRHHLHLDQMGKLQDEILLVMLAFAEPAEFADNLVRQLNIAAPTAAAIANDISSEIFMPIRQSMQAFVESHALLEVQEDESAVAEPPQKKEGTNPTELPVAISKTATPSAPPPTPAPNLHPADMMLSQKTVTVVPPGANTSAPPTKPTTYKADPYREPPIP